ncbi:MAG: glycosyltransferase family 2 protein [Chloroflexota bacterium]|nr:glycosyltransferase family 2 protein [Chloroflexota bacterium]
MATNRLSLSVIVPNYNHARFLRDSLGSICDQSRPADEIIVVDDASTDDSVAIITEFAARYPNIRLIRNQLNIGAIGAVNLGISQATATHIHGAAADDRHLPTFIERSMAALERYPQAGLCVSEPSLLDEQGEHVTVVPLELGSEPGYLAPEAVFWLMFDRYLWLAGHTAIYNRRTFVNAGGFRPSLRWHCD